MILYVFYLKKPGVTIKCTTCATTYLCGKLLLVEGCLTCTHHHPSTNHNLPHGRVVTQIVPFVMALELLILFGAFLEFNTNAAFHMYMFTTIRVTSFQGFKRSNLICHSLYKAIRAFQWTRV